MLKVDLIRHGVTGGNIEKRYVGRTDEPLCREGIDQLRKIADRRKKSASFVPQLVFASPMLRCRMTAEILFPQKEIHILEGFRETDFGSFEYKTYEELKDLPEYITWLESQGIARFPQGESRQEAAGRIRKAWSDAIKVCEREKIAYAAFVIHGGTVMELLEAFGVPKKCYYDWMVSNASGYTGWWDEKAERIRVERNWP